MLLRLQLAFKLYLSIFFFKRCNRRPYFVLIDLLLFLSEYGYESLFNPFALELFFYIFRRIYLGSTKYMRGSIINQ